MPKITRLMAIINFAFNWTINIDGMGEVKKTQQNRIPYSPISVSSRASSTF